MKKTRSCCAPGLRRERSRRGFRTVLGICMALMAGGMAWAQTGSPDPQDPRTSQGQTDGPGTPPTADASSSALDEFSGQPSARAGNAASTMSADQIISILRQQPELLSSLRSLAAQQIGADPETISDQQVYSQLRDDAVLRQKATAQLEELGYLRDSQSKGTQAQGLTVDEGENPGGLQSRASGSARLPTSLPARQRDLSSEDTQTEQPALRLRPVPYRGIPSFQELYSQVRPDTSKLRRFGSDIFLTSTGNADTLPLDVPAGTDYVLGPGDSLVLNIWGSQSERLMRTIDRQGQIALPEAGTLMVAGLSIAQAQVAIQKALNTEFQNEHAEIALGKLRTVRVYVVGDVQRPGAYDVSSLSTPLNALYAAGGPTSRGSLRVLRHYRGNTLAGTIDLYDFLLHGVLSDSERLLPGDTILVPPVGPQVSVGGMVRRPAIYELRGAQDIQSVLDLAGGVLVTANLTQVSVERIEAHQRHTMLSIPVADGASAATAKLPAFAMQDGDEVFVSPILPYNEQVVYLEGHVFRPGRYPWRDGMTVNDLLHSYQDVMPEPSEHAEIVRLQPPDLHPRTIPFDLRELLVGNDPVTLQPFDVIRVFSRYELDPPKVSIYGDVLRPGEYPMSEDMTVAGLVLMAGGFRRSAYREEADLSSYTVQDGRKVLLKHTVVEIGKALDGDKRADRILQPGDVVSIRELSGWKDIGASVTIDGEVQFAGTYGIENGERLSAVLKRAGGFREDAYPAGAILERVQVRQVEESNRQAMIRRIETAAPSIKPGFSTAQDQTNLLQAMQQQQQEVLNALRNHPASGRLVIRISGDIRQWENTPSDIVLRAGDRLTIPKLPGFVVVSGQVYNATGIAYRPGRDASWYLQQAGGATRFGDKKQIFVIRADGSVVGRTHDVFGGTVLDLRLRPGDSLVVPEKVIGGSMIWRNLIGTAQIMSSVALSGAAAGIF